MTADSARHARDELRSKGLIVRDMRLSNAHQRSRRKYFKRSIDAGQWASIARDLSTLLRVGVPLVDALGTLSIQHTGHLSEILLSIKDRVSAGSSFAMALQDEGVFQTLDVTLVDVGEHSGKLDDVLGYLAEYREKSLAFRDRLVTALAYPAVVFVTGLCVMLFLMTFVVPTLMTNLIQAGQQLPWPTRLLNAISYSLVNFWWLLLAIMAAIIIASVIFLRSERGGRLRDQVLLKLPIIGDLVRKQAISRIALVMATLLRSDVEFLVALGIASKSTTNLVIRDALESAGDKIQAGEEIASAFKSQSHAIPYTVIHLFSLGQQSGQLEELLEQLAENYDRQTETASTRFASILEPLLIVVLAIFVGFILFATDRKSTRLNSSHTDITRMPSSA